MVRNDHLVDAEFIGQPGSVQRGGAAEGDHGARRYFLAALDGMDAGRARHIFVDDFDDAEGGGRGVQDHGDAYIASNCSRGRVRIQGHGAAGEAFGFDSTEQHVGVGDRGPFTAKAIAGGPRFGAGALRADVDAP